jgi:hypothetical protein
MNNNIFNLFIVLGAVFGFLAALIAYLIIYKEQMNYFSTKKEKRKEKKGLGSGNFYVHLFLCFNACNWLFYLKNNCLKLHQNSLFKRIYICRLKKIFCCIKMKSKYRKTLLALIIPLAFVLNLPILGNVALADTMPAINVGSSTNTSLNWAGYVASNSSYNGIGASWTIPTVTNTANTSADATWIGIGGVNSQNLIQAGTQAISENGSINYIAWYELLPAGMIQVPLAVSPGNSVTVSLAENSSNLWTINFRNNTTNQNYSTSVSYTSSNSSAEWIEEMPTLAGGSSFIPLDNFGSVQFTGGYVMQNNNTLNILQSGARSLTMVTSNDQSLAIPSSLDSSGSDFSVSRTNVAPDTITTIPSTHTGWHRTGVGIRNFHGNFRRNIPRSRFQNNMNFRRMTFSVRKGLR